jgi:hypothetical protein
MIDFLADWWSDLTWSAAMAWFVVFVFLVIVPIWVWLGVRSSKRHWQRERLRIRSPDPKAIRDVYRTPER